MIVLEPSNISSKFLGRKILSPLGSFSLFGNRGNMLVVRAAPVELAAIRNMFKALIVDYELLNRNGSKSL
jgi:hypothetical protein